MKLVKINNSHFIIVSDKIAGYTYNKPTWNSDNRVGLPENNQSKKITHSTQPLEGVLPLDLLEVKVLIGEVDVKKLATQEYLPYQENSVDLNTGLKREGYIKGYKQCLEDNKEKKYTEYNLVQLGLELLIKNPKDMTETNLIIMDFVKQFQPKIEWDVEFVDGKLKLI